MKEYRDGERTCTCCEERKPSSAFYQYRRVCKSCIVINQRKARRQDVPAMNNWLLQNWRRA